MLSSKLAPYGMMLALALPAIVPSNKDPVPTPLDSSSTSSAGSVPLVGSSIV